MRATAWPRGGQRRAGSADLEWESQSAKGGTHGAATRPPPAPYDYFFRRWLWTPPTFLLTAEIRQPLKAVWQGGEGEASRSCGIDVPKWKC